MKKINMIPTPAEYTLAEEMVPFIITGASISGDVGDSLVHALKILCQEIQVGRDGNLVLYVGCQNFPDWIKNENRKFI